MKAKLLSRWRTEGDEEHWIGEEASIGRASDNDVRLDAGAVSGRHARIFWDAEVGAYFLEDLESLNGTELDGTPVNRKERLGRLHLLAFGGASELLFVEVDRSPDVETEAVAPASAGPVAEREGTVVDRELPPLPAALRAGAAGKPGGATRIEKTPVVLPGRLVEGGNAAAEEPEWVLEIDDEGTRRRFPLRPGRNLVGRSRGAAVALKASQLSRRHARLTIEGERVTLRDLGSRNHTFVGDRQIDDEVEIAAGERLRFGTIEARLLRSREAPE